MELEAVGGARGAEFFSLMYFYQEIVITLAIKTKTYYCSFKKVFGRELK